MLDDIRIAWIAWGVLIACAVLSFLPHKPK